MWQNIYCGSSFVYNRGVRRRQRVSATDRSFVSAQPPLRILSPLGQDFNIQNRILKLCLHFVSFGFNIHNELNPHFFEWLNIQSSPIGQDFYFHNWIFYLARISRYFLGIYNWAFYQFTINMLANLRFQMEWSFISFYPRYQSQNLNLLIVFITF